MSLNNKTILSARPIEYKQPLERDIALSGGRLLFCPAIEINPITPPPLNLLVECDLIIFTSVAAVKYGLPALNHVKLSFNKVAAIGPVTASALTERAVPVDYQADGKSCSENLLLALPKVSGKKIIIVKGQGGRDYLEKSLIKSHAQVTLYPVYERRCPPPLEKSQHALWKKNRIDIILGNSIETMTNLFAVLGPDGQSFLQTTPWLLMSERLLDTAIQLGIQHPHIAQCDTLTNSLKQWARRDTV